jgi:hypothetical protein
MEWHSTQNWLSRTTLANTTENREYPNDVVYSHKSIEQALKEAGNSIKYRKEVLQQNFYCVTTGSLA